MSNLSLLGSTSRVETPYIKVIIGDYTFGVYQKTDATVKDGQDFYIVSKITYPNYVQSLTVTKINGQVNEYSLSLCYPIRPEDDPNFFEKVFSSVSKSRKIVFSYGDMSNPTYIYKNEEAIITKVNTSFDLKGCRINYQVTAVSSATLGLSGTGTFQGGNFKPSDKIIELLYSPKYKLTDIFYGMSNLDLVNSLSLIARDDKVVNIQTKENISVLEYLNYLVSCMVPSSSVLSTNDVSAFYIMTIHDEIAGETINDSVIETLGGPYFKISKVSKRVDKSTAYEIDIGYPTSNIVMGFNLIDNENYSIYYDWQKKLTDNEFVLRLNDEGEWEKTFASSINSDNAQHETRINDSTWWSKITQFPVSATITLKGLLRPATLMEYVRLNVLFFGKKHISSGLYIVTKQVDDVSSSGYKTTLSLTRVQGDE